MSLRNSTLLKKQGSNTQESTPQSGRLQRPNKQNLNTSLNKSQNTSIYGKGDQKEPREKSQSGGSSRKNVLQNYKKSYSNQNTDHIITNSNNNINSGTPNSKRSEKSLARMNSSNNSQSSFSKAQSLLKNQKSSSPSYKFGNKCTETGNYSYGGYQLVSGSPSSNSKKNPNVINKLGLQFERVCQIASHDRCKVSYVCVAPECDQPERQGCANCFLEGHSKHENGDMKIKIDQFLEQLNIRHQEYYQDIKDQKRVQSILGNPVFVTNILDELEEIKLYFSSKIEDVKLQTLRDFEQLIQDENQQFNEQVQHQKVFSTNLSNVMMKQNINHLNNEDFQLIMNLWHKKYLERYQQANSTAENRMVELERLFTTSFDKYKADLKFEIDSILKNYNHIDLPDKLEERQQKLVYLNNKQQALSRQLHDTEILKQQIKMLKTDITQVETDLGMHKPHSCQQESEQNIPLPQLCSNQNINSQQQQQHQQENVSTPKQIVSNNNISNSPTIQSRQIFSGNNSQVVSSSRLSQTSPNFLRQSQKRNTTNGSISPDKIVILKQVVNQPQQQGIILHQQPQQQIISQNSQGFSQQQQVQNQQFYSNKLKRNTSPPIIRHQQTKTEIFQTQNQLQQQQKVFVTTKAQTSNNLNTIQQIQLQQQQSQQLSQLYPQSNSNLNISQVSNGNINNGSSNNLWQQQQYQLNNSNNPNSRQIIILPQQQQTIPISNNNLQGNNQIILQRISTTSESESNNNLQQKLLQQQSQQSQLSSRSLLQQQKQNIPVVDPEQKQQQQKQRDNSSHEHAAEQNNMTTVPIFQCCNQAFKCQQCHNNYFKDEHEAKISTPSQRYCLKCQNIFTVNVTTIKAVPCVACLSSQQNLSQNQVKNPTQNNQNQSQVGSNGVLQSQTSINQQQ